MNELEKLLARMAELETVAERSAKEEKELKKAQTRVAELEKERDLDAEKRDAKLANLERKEAIREVGEQFNASADMVRTFVKDKTKSVQDFKDALLEERTNQAPDIPGNVMSEDGRKDMLRNIEDSLVLRLGGAVAEPKPGMKVYANASLIDLARAITGETGYDKEKIAERAMVTADFPNLLLAAGNRVLMDEFEAAGATYRQFVQEVDVNDFRENSDNTAGGGGKLDKITESGELKEGYLGENSEKWALESYGKKFTITRKMIINDDLGAFTDMLALFGEMAALTANGLVYDLMMKRNDFSAYVMSDGVVIFHSDHSNLGSAALSSTTLSAGKAAMMKHKGLDGKTPLNITPTYLHVGPDLADTAHELVSSMAKVEDNKSSGVANPHQGKYVVVVDAEITGAQWFLSARRRTIKVGYLAGTGRRPVLKMNDSTLTKTVFEGIFDIGVVASDYRGLYAGNGVA